MKNDEKPLEPTVKDMPIARQILVIRDKQVMLDRDLATLYGVETKVLNQAVSEIRNVSLKAIAFNLMNYPILQSHKL